MWWSRKKCASLAAAPYEPRRHRVDFGKRLLSYLNPAAWYTILPTGYLARDPLLKMVPGREIGDDGRERDTGSWQRGDAVLQDGVRCVPHHRWSVPIMPPCHRRALSDMTALIIRCPSLGARADLSTMSLASTAPTGNRLATPHGDVSKQKFEATDAISWTIRIEKKVPAKHWRERQNERRERREMQIGGRVT